MELPVATRVRTVAPASHPSPLRLARFMPDSVRVLCDPHVPLDGDVPGRAPSFEQAGPRRLLAFSPPAARAGIVTCGGLCPGINDVVRGLVMELQHRYGVAEALGIPYGFDGLVPGRTDPPRTLAPADVAAIHAEGGTVLGTCRGTHDPVELAASVDRLGLSVLFCIGGDGTLKGALAIDRELRARGSLCAVVGIPKTIDNDIAWCSRTFGFETAVQEAARSVAAAHVEARGHADGVGLVKLMGREAGFIAAHAALACPEANFVLVPEVRFDLGGEHGLLAALERRLRERRHAVVVVAEGAGADLIPGRATRDASGNVKPGDIGRHLAEAIPAGLRDRGLAVTLKYIDPSYDIRSVPACADDKVLCGHLAKMAAHAGLAGKTGLMIGLWNDLFVHVPLETATSSRKRLNADGLTWQSVLASTGQPPLVAPA
jgi:6-phosphofructokinase 1